MSESTEKPQEENKAESNTPATEKVESNVGKKSSKMILFGFIGLTSILMLALGVLATLLLTGGNQATQVTQTNNKHPGAKKEAKKEEHKEEKKEEKDEKKEEGGHESKDGQQADSSRPEFYQVRPSIVITLPASGRTRYVSLDIDLMTHTKSSVKTLEAYAPLIKSNLIDLLSKQTFDEMITEEGKKNLRKQALTLLQTLMNEQAGDPIIEQVLFTSFIVQ